MKAAVNEVKKNMNVTAEVKEEYLMEVCRYGAAELHNIAAFMGGVASQEIIKLLTHQYIPLNNTLIFNGMNASSLQEKF